MRDIVLEGEFAVGDVVIFDPKWQDPGEKDAEYVIIEVNGDRVDVKPLYFKGRIVPTQTVKVDYIGKVYKFKGLTSKQKKEIKRLGITTEALTKGIKNAMARSNPKLKCGSCGFSCPPYPGRYPKACPECGGAWEMSEATTTDTLKIKDIGFPTYYIYRCNECKHEFTSGKFPRTCPKCDGSVKRVGLARQKSGPIVLPTIFPTGKILKESRLIRFLNGEELRDVIGKGVNNDQEAN